VFRRCGDELNRFTLVGQTVFEVKEGGLGELLVDISTDPLQVKAGDLIGLHVIDSAVIPFDEDETRLTTLYWQSLDGLDSAGSNHIEMDTDMQPARTYSLSAKVLASCECSSLASLSSVLLTLTVTVTRIGSSWKNCD